jgi:hypothetical protein
MKTTHSFPQVKFQGRLSSALDDTELLHLVHGGAYAELFHLQAAAYR